MIRLQRLALALWLLLCLATPSWAASGIPSACVWECRGTVLNGSPGPGNDANGGGFVAGASGTDYSTQNSPQLALTDVVTTGTTTVTSVAGGFTTAMIGNLINIVGDNRYEITARASTNSVTVDRTTGTATGQTGNVGGALGGSAVNSGLAALASATTGMAASNKAYCAGAFTSNATITFATGATPSGTTAATRIIGYGTTRGDSTHATLTLQTNTGLTGLNGTGTAIWFEQMDVDCGSLGTSIGIASAGTASRMISCKIANFTTSGVSITAPRTLISDCEVTGGTSAATAGINHNSNIGTCIRCFVHDNACKGVTCLAGFNILQCLVVNNTGASSDGIQANNATTILNCTIHGNGRDGIHNQAAGYDDLQWRNNILTSNGGYGINGATVPIPAMPDFDGNAYGGGSVVNTLGARNNMDSVSAIYGVSPYTNTRDVTLTASPYVGPTTGTSANFALNDVPGGGQACRRAGSPGTWPGNTGTTGYPDMGGVQTRSNIRIPRGAMPPKAAAKKKVLLEHHALLKKAKVRK